MIGGKGKLRGVYHWFQTVALNYAAGQAQYGAVYSWKLIPKRTFYKLLATTASSWVFALVVLGRLIVNI